MKKIYEFLNADEVAQEVKLGCNGEVLFSVENEQIGGCEKLSFDEIAAFTRNLQETISASALVEFDVEISTDSSVEGFLQVSIKPKEKSNVQKFEDYIERTFHDNAMEKTIVDLGNRSMYIGASDISGCLRKAYLSKRQGSDWDVNQQVTFSRGHISEQIVRMMLKSDEFELLEQVEAIGETSNGFPLRAHIDFVARFKTTDIIIEAKSTATAIDKPYESWILQTQLQIKLHQANNPSISVRGYIIAFSSSETPFDNGRVFKIFEVLPTPALQKVALERADSLGEALQSNTCPDGEEQLYCSKCPFKMDCPVVLRSREAVEQLPADVAEVVVKLKGLTAVEKELKILKTQLKGFFDATGILKARAGNYVASLATFGEKDVVDVNALKASLPDVFMKYKKRESYSFVKIV